MSFSRPEDVARSSLATRIGALSAEVDSDLRAKLQGALRTLRGNHDEDIWQSIVAAARLMEGDRSLLRTIAHAAGKRLTGDTMCDQIEGLTSQGTIPPEIASDLHWLRLRANKGRHDAARVVYTVRDAEFALDRALRLLEWFYCEFERGPKLPGIYRVEETLGARPVSGPGSLDWEALLRHISEQRCTPFLGSALLEPYWGTPRDIAGRWADTYRYPMALHEREDLARVAQYVSTDKDRAYVESELIASLRREMLGRYATCLPEGLHARRFAELVAAVGRSRRENHPAEPHRVLAALPCPVFVTANPDNLLAEALESAGKQPHVEVCRWREEEDALEDWPPSIYEHEPDYRPTADRPLVYHLFGHLEWKHSMVLTEDDYFDFLIRLASNRDTIPKVVRRSLVDTAHVFVGFQLHDWDFRVLFRSLINQGGSGRRKAYDHVAIQLDPAADQMEDPDRAREYLRRYFQSADVSIYWRSVAEFMAELQTQWDAYSEQPLRSDASG